MSRWLQIFTRPGRMRLYVIHTGSVHMNGNIHFNKKSPVSSTKPRDSRYNPVYCFLINHPVHGYLLVDAGIHPDFCVKVSGNFGRLLGKMIKIKTGQGRDVLSQIKQIGLEAANIKAIIMSHLHPDHSSGLPLFQGNPHCTVYADEREYKKAESPGGIFQGYLKAHYKGLVIQPFTRFTGIEPFDQVSDFFGDESVFIIRTPGHTAGHISVLLNMQGGPVLLTVDAAHRQENLTGQIPTVGDYRQSLASLQKLQAFTSAHPATRVIYAHDPDQINGLKLFPEYYE